MPCLNQELRACAAENIRRLDDGSRAMTFTFPPDFTGFSGHFPDNPILPGVVQAMAAALCASEGRTTHLAGLSRAKFLLPISAGAVVDVVAGPVVNGKATVALKLDGEIASSMTITFDIKDGEA